MFEINLINLYIVFGLIIIRLRNFILKSLFFPILMSFLFLAYFVLDEKFLLLFLIGYGFKKCE